LRSERVVKDRAGVRDRATPLVSSVRIMKRAGSLLSEHEGLRRAVAWLIEQPRRDSRTIHEASRRFDLSPIDQDFLLNHFRDAAGRETGD
jgi:hypothetical protein